MEQRNIGNIQSGRQVVWWRSGKNTRRQDTAGCILTLIEREYNLIHRHEKHGSSRYETGAGHTKATGEERGLWGRMMTRTVSTIRRQRFQADYLISHEPSRESGDNPAALL